jgi:putative Ca2+/H+ antiporter (TMEM165/GDT1 family)
MNARSPVLREQVGETFRLCHVVVAVRWSRPRPAERTERVDPYVALICFPVIFVAELPDKTIFASLVMATKGRPSPVWLGAAAAYTAYLAAR